MDLQRALEESDFAQLAELITAPVAAHAQLELRSPQRQFVSMASPPPNWRQKREKAMQTQTAVATAPARPPSRPRHDQVENDPSSLEMLERLDDLVYDSIAGQVKRHLTS